MKSSVSPESEAFWIDHIVDLIEHMNALHTPAGDPFMGTPWSEMSPAVVVEYHMDDHMGSEGQKHIHVHTPLGAVIV